MASDSPSELRVFADRLQDVAAKGGQPSVTEPLSKLEGVASKLARAWSGSNMGYHSRVYYADFEPPPPGAHFDSEWGFLGQFQGTTGDWREYDFDEVVALLYRLADVSSLDEPAALVSDAHRAWSDIRSEVVSILSAYLAQHDDALVDQLRTEAGEVRDLTEMEAARAIAVPSRGAMLIRDTTAFSQGFMTAPHQSVQARIVAIRSAFAACSTLALLAERAATHIERLEASQQGRGQSGRAGGSKVFIGHGRSLLWRELKDFIVDRLHLQPDEFNRVPVAGVTNIARLSEMLDDAGIAFIVLTAEDETTDGREVARQNVVHEAGLFQGRLGFSRAILLLEDGCDEFSNIQGLGQLRFPTGNIAATFEGVRQALEREGFLED